MTPYARSSKGFQSQVSSTELVKLFSFAMQTELTRITVVQDGLTGYEAADVALYHKDSGQEGDVGAGDLVWRGTVKVDTPFLKDEVRSPGSGFSFDSGDELWAKVSMADRVTITGYGVTLDVAPTQSELR